MGPGARTGPGGASPHRLRRLRQRPERFFANGPPGGLLRPRSCPRTGCGPASARPPACHSPDRSLPDRSLVVPITRLGRPDAIHRRCQRPKRCFQDARRVRPVPLPHMGHHSLPQDGPVPGPIGGPSGRVGPSRAVRWALRVTIVLALVAISLGARAGIGLVDNVVDKSVDGEASPATVADLSSPPTDRRRPGRLGGSSGWTPSRAMRAVSAGVSGVFRPGEAVPACGSRRVRGAREGSRSQCRPTVSEACHASTHSTR